MSRHFGEPASVLRSREEGDADAGSDQRDGKVEEGDRVAESQLGEDDYVKSFSVTGHVERVL